MTEMTEIIKREVKAQLARRGMTQEQLAAQVGIGKVHLSRLMRGSGEGSISTWQKIFDALDLELTVQPVERDE